MKVLHTGDWHLGHVLYNYDRSAEQSSFLAQLVEIVRLEKPDVMLLGGDVYHYANPSSSAQRMFTEAMLRIHDASPDMTVVVTAGNHDSGQKIEIDRSLWGHFGVYVIGGLYRDENGVDIGRHIIEIRDGDSRLKGYVAAIPHVYPNNFPSVAVDTPREERQRCFFQKVLDTVAERNVNALPVVLMAHLAVGGSDTTGHDDTVGGMDYTDIRELGEGYSYLALGHIHRPQTMSFADRTVRYSGSPIPVSFDENYRHSVTLVEMAADYHPIIRTIDIDNPVPLITVPDSPQPFEQALSLLADFPSDKNAYVRLNISVDGYLPPDCNELANKAVEGKACKFCYIKINRTKDLLLTGGAERISVQEMKEINPMDIARLYYKENEGDEMDGELLSLMDEAIASVVQKDNVRE